MNNCLPQATSIDGHDKPFRTKAIKITDNFKKALGDTDNQYISICYSDIDKLSPIYFSDKCCGKFSICLTRFFLLVSQIAKLFFQIFQKRAVYGLCRALAINKTKRIFFKLQQDFMDTAHIFHSVNTLTLNTIVCIKNRLSR